MLETETPDERIADCRFQLAIENRKLEIVVSIHR